VRLVRGGQALAFLSEPSSASQEEIQALIRNRTWVGEKLNTPNLPKPTCAKHKQHIKHFPSI
jgi:hypothetical protein